MKNTILILGLIGLSLAANAQKDSSGIYFTADDYLKQKLFYGINCKTEKHKIKTDILFNSKEVVVKHMDSTYRFPKDSVYGVKYCDGTITRIFKGSEFPIINPTEQIIIYKVVSGLSGKGSSVKTTYYFSKDAKSGIQMLTISKLKAAFPENHKFHDLIDMNFHDNEELAKYDDFHKMMKISRVLMNSLEK